jgi:hypothetical protein
LGKAIEALAKMHRLRGYEGMRSGRFWKVDLKGVATDPAAVKKQAEELLGVVNTAMKELLAAKADAKVNADIIDYFLFGAERMKLMATRELETLEAMESYQRACEAKADSEKARGLIEDAVAKISGIREAHNQLKARYAELWQRENKPYALDVILRRFEAVIGFYDERVRRLRAASDALATQKKLPLPSEIGL